MGDLKHLSDQTALGREIYENQNLQKNPYSSATVWLEKAGTEFVPNNSTLMTAIPSRKSGWGTVSFRRTQTKELFWFVGSGLCSGTDCSASYPTAHQGSTAQLIYSSQNSRRDVETFPHTSNHQERAC